MIQNLEMRVQPRIGNSKPAVSSVYPSEGQKTNKDENETETKNKKKRKQRTLMLNKANTQQIREQSKMQNTKVYRSRHLHQSGRQTKRRSDCQNKNPLANEIKNRIKPQAVRRRKPQRKPPPCKTSRKHSNTHAAKHTDTNTKKQAIRHAAKTSKIHAPKNVP